MNVRPIPLFRILPLRILLLLLILCRSTANAQDPPTQEPIASDAEEKIRVDVNAVTLRFSVKDLQGRFVNTLSQEQFEVRENGRRQGILFFEPPRSQAGESAALWLAFLLDVSGSTFSARAEEILAARSFFENIYGFTLVGIFGFTDKLLPFQDFTADKAAALAAFGSARQHLGKTAIYDSTSTLIEMIRQVAGPADRKVIIIVSDGIDDNFQRSPAVVAQARQAGVNLYTIWVPSASQLYIGPATPQGSPQDILEHTRLNQEKQSAFEKLSQQTGGRHFGGFETILDFDEVLAEINDDIYGNLYTLGYQTEFPYLDRWERDVQVQIDQNGLAVQGLIKNVPERVLAKKRYIAALFDDQALAAIPAQISSPFHEIRAEMDILKGHREGAVFGLPFRIKISPRTLIGSAEEGVKTQIGIIGSLVSTTGPETVRLREIYRATLSARDIRDGRGIIYVNKLLAPPGSYTLRVALLEISSWKMTVLEERVQLGGRQP